MNRIEKFYLALIEAHNKISFYFQTKLKMKLGMVFAKMNDLLLEQKQFLT